MPEGRATRASEASASTPQACQSARRSDCGHAWAVKAGDALAHRAIRPSMAPARTASVRKLTSDSEGNDGSATHASATAPGGGDLLSGTVVAPLAGGGIGTPLRPQIV